jgi:membrane-associated phospholipid phosphatase
MVAAGVAAPLLRRRVNVSPFVWQSVAYAAPVGLCVAVRRSPARDVAVCTLNMWAYLAAYKTPHDDEAAQAARVHVNYPIVADRALGLGELPTVRLQRWFSRYGENGPEWRTLDRILVWAHWSWFLVPHGTVAYLLARDPERFPRGAAITYTVFNLGAGFYWVLPTAPPWYAVGAEEKATPARLPTHPSAHGVRRVMVEYGEHFWRDGWGSLYSVFGGNPLAAMPSLHFATSMTAALLLGETGPLAGTLGWTYTATLGFALVYLGEHYVVDLVAGAALAATVRRLAPRAGPLFAFGGRAVAAVEAAAHGVG